MEDRERPGERLRDEGVGGRFGGGLVHEGPERVVPEAPGLFFCGLSFQSSFSSMLLAGAGRDAAYVVDRLVARRAHQQRVPAAA